MFSWKCSNGTLGIWEKSSWGCPEQRTFYMDMEMPWAIGEKMERGARKLFKDGRSEGKKFDDAQ